MKGFTGFSFKSMFAASSQSAAAAVVAIGDRFAHNHNDKMVWVVDHIQDKTAHRQPLITLYREGYPDLRKVLSEAALGNDSEFHRLN